VHILHIRPHGPRTCHGVRARLVRAESGHIGALPLLLPLHLHHAREPAMAARQGQARGCTPNTRNDGARQRQGLSGELSQQARGARAAGEAAQEQEEGAHDWCDGPVQVSPNSFE
jgi:hypothetical protein